MGFSVSRHGLFGTGVGATQKKKKTDVIGDLSRDILSSTAIDEVTRNELLGRPAGTQGAKGVAGVGIAGANYASTLAIFNAAKEGIDPKFKARVKTQALFDIGIDQPGAKQLRTDVMFNVGSNRMRA